MVQAEPRGIGYTTTVIESLVDARDNKGMTRFNRVFVASCHDFVCCCVVLYLLTLLLLLIHSPLRNYDILAAVFTDVLSSCTRSEYCINY
jgi:hypothetical protein